ncbi:MAG TPA: NlpC/P60 family protein [Syntrophales bacterium]|jgi:hypothetical protein|nr:NlpC/P60 family protein [Syntrophales bacterium]
MTRSKYRNIFLLGTALLFVLNLLACAAKGPVPSKSPVAKVRRELPRLGYTIQVGAFAKVENAARLADGLRDRGLNAIYYVSHRDLYKVRFGNYPTRELARRKAEKLRASGMIAEFYIVSPDAYAVAKQRRFGTSYLRGEIVKTAETFIGLPYLWGGMSADTGFDCSGLAMTVYQLNGLDLPRHSGDQFEAGVPVDPEDLQPGDLVFFQTRGNGRVTHVGIFVGDGDFIHAAGTGKNIRKDSLSSSYYKRCYAGGKSYL